LSNPLATDVEVEVDRAAFDIDLPGRRTFMFRGALALEYPDAVFEANVASDWLLLVLALHDEPQTPELDFSAGV